ncbi:ABC1 kinase family protein [Mycobacteroides abscessus]|uniref:ABC1 kinase family protein n=1 Tax=Mycobacteroides abscessus TaxID=36809 RepID=UPI00078D422E|nr:AarF/ABC1/UbiB kinase family protein [Mycobacteroides abscessus]AMU75755.1 ATP-binding protein [Mycobacteroides abscessus]ANO24699.1 ATP-binding protein [Mycobacteroides abscessus]
MAKAVGKSRITRGGKLGKLAAEQAVRGAGARLSMIGRSQRAREILSERATIDAADRLVTVLGGMKGAAMKLGQMLSVIDLNLVPESHRDSFRQKLAALRDNAPTESFPAIRKVIETEIGHLSRVFSEFDETPVGAASIGQVYRARLRDGRDVAVKVQYPGVEAAIAADLKNLALFTKLGKTIWPSLGVPGFLDEIAANIERELDYLQEARTQHHMARVYQGHPFIGIPDSVPEHSTKRVLVTQYVQGTAFEELRTRPGTQRNEIGELIYRFYVGSLFLSHEFCGDPHPGNILGAADGKLIFLDFGLFNQMSAVNVEFERCLLRAAAERRAQDLYAALIERGVIDADSGISPSACLDYIWQVAEWHLADETITVTPELASGALVEAIDPRGPAQFAGIKRQLLPAEHVFSRRADFFTFGVLGLLGATNNWHRIAREWLYHEPPATPVSREIAAWQKWREENS